MLNCCLRCSTIFAGIISLIQAVVWAGISIWGIAMYDCSAYFPYTSKFGHLFYISYIRGACANTNFTYVAPSAERTYNILMAYSIISSIWVPTSVMLLAGTCLGARGIKAKWIYSPWLLITAASCLLDIYATIVYAIDISKTMTVTDYLEFLQIPDYARSALGLEITRGLDGVTFAPAILMTVFATRFILFWFINLFLLAFGFQGICAFSKRISPKRPAPYNQRTKGTRESWSQTSPGGRVMY